MNTIVKMMALFATTLFCGCVSYRAPLNSTDLITGDTCCVYGRFAYGDKYGALRLSIILQNLETKEIARIEFQRNAPVVLIPIIPGRYRITGYTIATATAGTMYKSEWRDIPYTPEIASNDFVAKPGTAYYIGDYIGSTKAGGKDISSSTQVGYSIMNFTFSGSIDQCANNYDISTKQLHDIYSMPSAYNYINVCR